VELPEYVRRVVKPGNRAFYYFAKHRGTPEAWPAIALPPPFDQDFPERYAICRALERRADGFAIGTIVLPDHRSNEFWGAASAAKKALDVADHRSLRTFTALVADFKGHEQYKSLSASTRRGYDHYAEAVQAAWADDLPADLTTVAAQKAIDALGETPAAANQFRAYLSRLMAFGIPRGYCTANPIKHTEKMPAGDPWPSWPDWAFALFFRHAPIHIAFPAVSALFTGQRQSDVLAMPRPKRGDMTIPVRAQKTGTIVWIPIHSEYRKWIEAEEERRRILADARERAGLVPRSEVIQLHVGARGNGLTPDGYRADWRRLMHLTIDKAKPFAEFQKAKIVFHGLRKNAVVMLLEAGCTETQVGAIVNMSEQMVRHYGRDVRIRALAQDGMKLLENRWAELRPKSLPAT
jgi:hypothetical protein